MKKKKKKILQDSVLMQMFLIIKMAEHVNRRGTTAKENDVSKRIRLHSYDLYFKIVVMNMRNKPNVSEAARKYTVS
jgi:hypothetical protein